jgi:asparagine synthase (glutamine-hydrolysing)
MLHRRNHTRLPEAFLQRIFPDLPGWPTGLQLFGQVETEPDRVAQCVRWNEFTGYLPMILLKIDRGSMYNSLEVRVPFLDRDVIDVATRVDWRSCMNVEQKIGKLPLRYSLGRHVQHQTWDKRGFTFAMGNWLKNSLRPVFEDLVLERREILGLPMRATAVREIFDNHLSGKAEYGYGLWVLLSLGMWEKRHGNRWNRSAA